MPFQAAPNVIQANMNFLIDGQKCEMVFHFMKGSTVTGTDVQNIANQMISNFWFNHLRNDMSNSVQLINVVATDIGSQTGFQHTAVPAVGADFGTFGSNPVPNNVALVMTLKTNERSKNGRGRKFVPGTPIARIAGTIRVTNQQLVDVLASFGALFTVATLTGTQLAVLSRWLNKTLRPVARPLAVMTILGDVSLDSQRRRLEGRGT